MGLYKWEHLVRDASRVDRGADDDQIVCPVCMNFFAAFRQREIIGIHRDAECVSDRLRQRGNNLFRVAGRAEIDCVYVIDFHENTFSSYA